MGADVALLALQAAGVRAATWLLTYALHSTILLGAAWLLARTLVRAEAARDVLWKAGLVGGLVTATIQVAFGVRPLAGRIPLAHRSPLGIAERRQTFVTVRRSGTGRVVVSRTVVLDGAAGAGEYRPRGTRQRFTTRVMPYDLGPLGSRPLRVHLVRRGGWWPALLAAGWLAAAAVLLAGLARSNRRLRAGLVRRESALCAGLAATLARLCAAAGVHRAVRLTCSPALASPAALGRGEICVPERAVVDLDDEQQESMLAHELAHLVRGDAWWLAAAAVLERLFFFQPLNRLARRELRDLAEYLCDDWAVARTGRPISLARCLHTVATWLTAAAPVQPVTAMLRPSRSPLVRRTERLLASSGAAGRPPRWGAVVAAACLPALAWLAPGVAPAPLPAGLPDARARVIVLADSLVRAPLPPWTDAGLPPRGDRIIFVRTVR